MSKPFFIVGPTAVGKTGLAVEVAECVGAEVVSADAFQVYAGLDLLTAKPSPDDRRRVTHHLIGMVPLGEAYNVARYLEDAQRAFRVIQEKNRPIIVVGGSGLYVKALTHGLSPLPGPQPEIRAELEREDCASLLERLHQLDAPAAAVIDGQNKRRLVRAIEVCLVTGKRFSDFRTLWQPETGCGRFQGVYLTRNKTDLYGRIVHRTEQMFAQGVLDEVHAVLPEHLSETSSQAIGYREIHLYFDGKISLHDCQSEIVLATRRYAKRQNTWFRAARNFEELDLTRVNQRKDQIEFMLKHFHLHQNRLSSEVGQHGL